MATLSGTEATEQVRSGALPEHAVLMVSLVEPAERRFGRGAGQPGRAAARRADRGLDPLMEAACRECVTEERRAGPAGWPN